jgi:hypothetical protein
VLGSAVTGRVGLAFDAGNGTDVNDAATSLQQIRQGNPAQLERPVRVDAKILCPIVVGHRLRPAHPVSPGDVDEDV